MSDSAALHLLQKLLDEACEESVLPAIVQEKQLRAVFGPAQKGVLPNKQSELTERTAVVNRAGLDIYGQEKPTDTKYFTCTNCGRQIAGNRFAAHVAKCVTRGRRQKSAF